MTGYKYRKALFRLNALTLVIFPSFWAPTAGAQSIENVIADFNGEKVIITYDINDNNPCDKYNVSFYNSSDNYSKPLNFIAGNYMSLSPDSGYQVVWDAKTALTSIKKNYEGDLSFRVKASKIKTPGINAVQIVRPENKSRLVFKKSKNGTPLEVNWQGGTSCDSVTILLYNQTTSKDIPLAKTANTNHQILFIKKSVTYNNRKYKVPAGNNYQLKLITSNGQADLKLSEPFKIKGGSAAGVILPLLVIGGGVGYFVSHGSSSPSDTNTNNSNNQTPTVTDLPGAPGPPN